MSRSLAALPDDLRCSLIVGSGDMTVGELREMFARPSAFRVLTTGQASEAFGYSGETWRGWADEGRIHGAYRDEGETGAWRLPMLGCEEHLARLQSGTLHRKRKRGPWEGTPAQTERTWPALVQEGPMVGGGSEAVGRESLDAEKPARSGLAGARRTHR